MHGICAMQPNRGERFAKTNGTVKARGSNAIKYLTKSNAFDIIAYTSEGIWLSW